MKQIMRILLCAALLAFIPHLHALCGVDYTYTVADGKAVITGYLGKGAKVKVPATFGDVPVKEIGSNAFSNQGGLKNITLPEGITVLQGNAFWGCPALTRIKLPESLTTIGARAFGNCNSLESITIPSGVNYIAPMAFYTGTLTDISVEEGNDTYQVVDGVLFDKANKTLHTYPDKKSGDSYIVPEGTIAIGESAFFTCYNLKSVTLPGSLTAIGINAFYSCGNMTGIELPNSLTVIGSGAFSYSNQMQNIIIPKSVTGIGYGAFTATNMDKILLEAGNTVYRTVDGVLYDIDNKILHTYPNKKTDTDYLVEDSTKAIGDYAFMHAFSLKDITLPESTHWMGTYSFAYCTGLSTITLPRYITDIGFGVFYTCTALNNIVIPENVTMIGSSAFDSCISLKSVMIPDSVTAIEYSAFNNCPLLTIHASNGSYASQYATENNIPFAAK
jgi:hypothetical protein